MTTKIQGAAGPPVPPPPYTHIGKEAWQKECIWNAYRCTPWSNELDGALAGRKSFI